MTITLFVAICTLGAAVTSLVTESIKKFYSNMGKECSPNAVALINAVIVGVLGTAVAYILLGIPWTVNNIICLVLSTICVWIGSMIGYDKVLQLVQQIANTGGK